MDIYKTESKKYYDTFKTILNIKCKLLSTDFILSNDVDGDVLTCDTLNLIIPNSINFAGFFGLVISVSNKVISSMLYLAVVDPNKVPKIPLAF